MKRWICLLLCLALLLTGCRPAPAPEPPEESLSQWTDRFYTELVQSLDDRYYVEQVEALYVSREYLEELSFNSRENIYFGCTLAELDEMFEGERYVFCPGPDGTTAVRPFHTGDEFQTAVRDQVMENLAIGAGVILICVTVSLVSGGLGAPAVSMIFMAGAKAGTAAALSSALFTGLTAAALTGFETGDPQLALESAALSASSGAKWGAITGALGGGMGEALALRGATLNGLTMNEAARIQQQNPELALDFIRNFHSMEEYEVYRQANLTPSRVGDSWALIRDIDWSYTDPSGRTNAQRVSDGLSPLDPTGAPYELHHIGQQADSPLAILTEAEHTDSYSILHTNTGQAPSAIDRTAFAAERSAFWLSLLAQVASYL